MSVHLFLCLVWMQTVLTLPGLKMFGNKLDRFCSVLHPICNKPAGCSDFDSLYWYGERAPPLHSIVVDELRIR